VPDDIWVAFGCDKAFAPHVAVVVESIVRNSPGSRFQFLILQEGFDPETQDVVEAHAPESVFTWVDMKTFELPEYKVSNHISHATLFRLALEQLAPDACKRLIYLDADLVVLKDLRALWEFDLEGATIGAIPDAALNSSEPGQDRHWTAWGLTPNAPYLNAGVLLIDLEEVRQERAFSKALQVIAEHGGDLPYQDQDAINWVFWNKWRLLPFEWNVQTVQFLKPYQRYLSHSTHAATQDPGIVHYTGAAKPWSADDYHPLSWLYWDILARTSYLDDVRQANSVSRWRLFRYWLRWLKRRPLAAYGKANFPSAMTQAKGMVKSGSKVA
jgi:lipopolysaccharide biosynthesis glycosyltransferase